MINLEKEIREQSKTLKNIKETAYPAIKEAVAEAKRRGIKYVYFAARGTSNHACIYAQQLFGTLIGLPCVLSNPSIITKYDGKLFLSDALVIGVSQSGAAEDVMAVLERGKKSGALTVGITNTPGSRVANAADYHIYLGVGDENSIAATKTFTAQLAVMTLICAEWLESKELFDGVDELPSKVAELFDTVPAQIEAMIDDFTDLENGIVLGRGYNKPIALEGALKIMETSKISMRGYPMSEFYHGPFAQLTFGGTVFLLASDGVMLDDSKAILEKLHTTPTRVVVLSDNDEILSGCKYAIKVPKTSSEVFSPYMFVIAMQFFALRLVERKGIDPDKSDVIKKITVTV